MIYFNNSRQAIDQSLSHFKDTNIKAMFEQRHKLINYYQHQNTDQYIKDYFGGTLQKEIPLYTTSITKKIVNRISMVYKEAPVRMYNGEVNPDIDSLFFRKNYQLKTIERIHNLVGTMLIQCIWNEYEEKIEYKPILEYEVTLNPDNPLQVMSILYPIHKTTDDIHNHQQDVFAYWTAEEHYHIQEDGKIIKINDDNINPYGVLPFVTVQPNNIIDEYFNIGDGSDIAIANQQIDISMTMLQHHIRSAGGQYWVNGRTDGNQIQLGLNKVVEIQDGTLNSITNSTNIDSIMKGIEHQIQHVCNNHHIAFDFGISTQKSGVAIKLENLELLEARQDDVEKFRIVEKGLHQIESAIIQAHMGQTLPEIFNVDFTEIEFPDPEREMAQWDWWIKNGIKDKIDYIMEKDPDKFASREEAIAYLDERITQRAERTNIFSLRQTQPNADIS